MTLTFPARLPHLKSVWRDAVYRKSSLKTPTIPILPLTCLIWGGNALLKISLIYLTVHGRASQSVPWPCSSPTFAKRGHCMPPMKRPGECTCADLSARANKTEST